MSHTCINNFMVDMCYWCRCNVFQYKFELYYKQDRLLFPGEFLMFLILVKICLILTGSACLSRFKKLFDFAGLDLMGLSVGP